MIQLHLMAESCTLCILAPGGQLGNFWINPRMHKPDRIPNDTGSILVIMVMKHIAPLSSVLSLRTTV